MLVNPSLANQTIATQFGDVQFDAEGKSKDLKADQEKVLGELPGFRVEAEKKAPVAKKEEPKEEAKEEEAKPATKAASKRTTKK